MLITICNQYCQINIIKIYEKMLFLSVYKQFIFSIDLMALITFSKYFPHDYLLR